MLRTLQNSLETMNFQANKMGIQISLLNTLGMYVAGITKQISNLNNLVKRAKAHVGAPESYCWCNILSVLGELATLPEVMTKLQGDLKEVANGRLKKSNGTKQADGAISSSEPLSWV
ncbi:hypothetical protein NDU88_002732 [Pleurodeles waltl]|uniref:Uncharacterized protein n=1 Tax=Pleurodeles waltl TaxID=8319 RepID=A0AAV7MQI7_PLEWA|nr:hypothetical protein NDU88_002732 [Pleurodeles waltl]